MKKIPVAISSCLLGNKVRYDGEHKQSHYCLKTLGECFDFKAVCPEMGIGMSAPRPPIHLVQQGEQIRVSQVDDHAVDVTESLKDFAQKQLDELERISGYIVIKNSPSCGMVGVKVFQEGGDLADSTSSGVYIGEIMAQRLELPVEEEGRLQNPALRENFINRVFAYEDWQLSVKQVPNLDNLTQFHQRYRYLLMAHEGLQQLEALLAQHQELNLTELLKHYEQQFMTCLCQSASVASHKRVLLCILDELKESLGEEAIQELTQLIEQYAQGGVTRLAPIARLNHHIQQLGHQSLAHQAYLNPEPIELALKPYQ